MVGRSKLRFITLELTLISFLGVVVFLSSCKGDFPTIYPDYLQRADKVIHLADIPEISRVLKGKSFKARLRSFFLSTGTYLVIQVQFKEKVLDDLLIVLTEDLRYRNVYSRSDFLLPAGYKFGTLLSEGYGGRILIGFEYVGDNPTLRSKLVAFDPSQRELPIIQTDTDGVCVLFHGGIPTQDSGGGTWIVQVFNNNTLNFTLLPITYLPPSPSPPSTGTNVSVFPSNPPFFTLSQYVKDPVKNWAALLFRSVNSGDGTGWVVYKLPIGPPGFGTSLVSYSPNNNYFQLREVFRDDLYFYTVDGIVSLKDSGPWLFFPFKLDSLFQGLIISSSPIEGPVIRIENSQVFHFTVDGKWFYTFDTGNLRVTRARTWW